MARFNPFGAGASAGWRGDPSRGARLGRAGNNPADYDGRATLYARHMGGDGEYDRGGAYWGHSGVWAVWTRGGAFCAYVEASSRESAILHVVTAAVSPPEVD